MFEGTELKNSIFKNFEYKYFESVIVFLERYLFSSNCLLDFQIKNDRFVILKYTAHVKRRP